MAVGAVAIEEGPDRGQVVGNRLRRGGGQVESQPDAADGGDSRAERCSREPEAHAGMALVEGIRGKGFRSWWTGPVEGTRGGRVSGQAMLVVSTIISKITNGCPRTGAVR